MQTLFKVSSVSRTDVFPPSPVRDFQVTKSGSAGDVLSYSFTAPGDDFEDGVGNLIGIKCFPLNSNIFKVLSQRS